MQNHIVFLLVFFLKERHTHMLYKQKLFMKVCTRNWFTLEKITEGFEVEGRFAAFK